MRRRGWEACAAVAVMVAAACAAPASETEPLPLQESAIVVEDDVRESSTQVTEFVLTEAQMAEAEEECADAEGIPLEAGDSCWTLLYDTFPPGTCTLLDICLRVYDVGEVSAAMAGYAEIVDPREEESLCEDGPGAVCLRVGLTPEALTRVVEPTPTEPTTTGTTPTETSPTTDTTSPTPSESTSPASPSSDLPSDSATP